VRTTEMGFTEQYCWQYATARDLARMRTEVSLLMRPHVNANPLTELAELSRSPLRSASLAGP
jgi:hypothetical protein